MVLSLLQGAKVSGVFLHLSCDVVVFFFFPIQEMTRAELSSGTWLQSLKNRLKQMKQSPSYSVKWITTLVKEFISSSCIPLLTCTIMSACVNCVRWSNSGQYLASGGDDKLCMIWQLSRYPGGVPTFCKLLNSQFYHFRLYICRKHHFWRRRQD